MSKDAEVSVIIASLNEEKSIGRCIEKVKMALRRLGNRGEIIVADNSTDRTADIARAAGAKVVMPDELGYGNALAFGIDHSVGQYIIIGDADGTYDFADAPKFFQPLRSGEAEFVIGSRFKGEIKSGSMPWLHRYIGNPVLTLTLNMLLGTNVSDAHCGIRGFTRAVWDKMDRQLVAEDLCSEMLRYISRNGLRVKEVPVVYYPRTERPKAGTLLHGCRCFRFLVLRILFNSQTWTILPIRRRSNAACHN
jgi:glycosyltransferase involved in cell wall biosynthesis